jgi:acetolactate synthase-1/2/3 large subunit
MRVSDYIMTRLAQAGASHVFQVTGRGALFLSDALAKSNELTGVSLHHEQSCAFAAIGYAEKKRGIGVCLVSTGCASTNAITGVLSAWQDGIPCIFISGQNILNETVRHTGVQLRTYGQQEADIVSLVSPITKYAYMLTKPQDIVSVMDQAIHAALSGRKGPVWIDVPLDLQSALIDPDTIPRLTFDDNANPIPSASDVRLVASNIYQAKRPVLLIGKGVRAAGAEELLAQLVEKWEIPLVYAASAPDSYSLDHNLSIGSVGAMGCSRAGNFAIQNSDYVLVLGSRLTALTTGVDYCKFAREANINVVDIDPVEHSKVGIRIDHFVRSDLKQFLSELLKEPAKTATQNWVEKCKHWKTLFSEVESQFNSPGVVDLYQLAESLGDKLPSGATLVTDSGLAEVILPTNVHFSKGMDCIHPASQGAMGFALPAAIGVQYHDELARARVNSVSKITAQDYCHQQ